MGLKVGCPKNSGSCPFVFPLKPADPQNKTDPEAQLFSGSLFPFFWVAAPLKWSSKTRVPFFPVSLNN